MTSAGLISIVVPCLNEEDNVRPLYERLVPVLVGTGLDYEIIFSLDPCTDATEERIREIRAADPRVRMVCMSRRFGQPAATIAGLRMSAGDVVGVIDCDLQDPPELIDAMVRRWREGFDVVYAQRRTREGETLVKRIVAATGYRVIRRVYEVLRLNESHGFLRGLVALVGFPQTSVLYDRDPRADGTSKYNRFFGSIRIGLNGIVGFSRYPLHLISLVGFVVSGFAILLALTYIGLRLAHVEIPFGNPTLVIIVSFLGGVQLLSLGVMGEYVGRVYDEVKRRPMFIIDRMEGFERQPTAARHSPDRPPAEP